METFTLSRKELHRPGLLKALCAGRVTTRQVAIALGLSMRQTRRLRRRFEASGAAGLAHRSRGRPSSRSAGCGSRSGSGRATAGARPGRAGAGCPRQPAARWCRSTAVRLPGSSAGGSPSVIQRPWSCSPYSLITRSAHSTNETNIAGLPHFALQLVKSASVTPRAREQAPQEKTGMCLATIFSIISLSGGQPMGLTASAVALRIR
jgi:hypothetical protein